MAYRSSSIGPARGDTERELLKKPSTAGITSFCRENANTITQRNT